MGERLGGRTTDRRPTLPNNFERPPFCSAAAPPNSAAGAICCAVAPFCFAFGTSSVGRAPFCSVAGAFCCAAAVIFSGAAPFCLDVGAFCSACRAFCGTAEAISPEAAPFCPLQQKSQTSLRAESKPGFLISRHWLVLLHLLNVIQQEPMRVNSATRAFCQENFSNGITIHCPSVGILGQQSSPSPKK